jgi:hypothetical protein
MPHALQQHDQYDSFANMMVNMLGQSAQSAMRYAQRACSVLPAASIH